MKILILILLALGLGTCDKMARVKKSTTPPPNLVKGFVRPVNHNLNDLIGFTIIAIADDNKGNRWIAGMKQQDGEQIVVMIKPK